MTPRTRKSDRAEEDDRLIAAESENHHYATVKRPSDLGKRFLKELEQFFVDYHELSKEKFRVRKCVGRRRALQLIKGGPLEAWTSRLAIGGFYRSTTAHSPHR